MRAQTGHFIDTDVIVDYLRDRREAVRAVERLGAPLYISVVSIAELYAWVREGDEQTVLERFLGAFRIIVLDAEIAIEAGRMRNRYGKSHGVGLADAMIAASVAATGSAFVTRNRKHYPMLKRVSVPY